MALDLEQILDSYRADYPPTVNTAQVAAMLGSTPEVVRAKVAAGEIRSPYTMVAPGRQVGDIIRDPFRHTSPS